MRWEKLGDLVLIPENAFTANDFKIVDTELYATVATCLTPSAWHGRLRESRAERIEGANSVPEGADGWVETKELGVTHGLDVTKVMFSSGMHGKNRMKNNARRNHRDLFAGIGYYT